MRQFWNQDCLLKGVVNIAKSVVYLFHRIYFKRSYLLLLLWEDQESQGMPK